MAHLLRQRNSLTSKMKMKIATRSRIPCTTRRWLDVRLSAPCLTYACCVGPFWMHGPLRSRRQSTRTHAASLRFPGGRNWRQLRRRPSTRPWKSARYHAVVIARSPEDLSASSPSRIPGRHLSTQTQPAGRSCDLQEPSAARRTSSSACTTAVYHGNSPSSLM